MGVQAPHAEARASLVPARPFPAWRDGGADSASGPPGSSSHISWSWRLPLPGAVVATPAACERRLTCHLSPNSMTTPQALLMDAVFTPGTEESSHGGSRETEEGGNQSSAGAAGRPEGNAGRGPGEPGEPGSRAARVQVGRGSRRPEVRVGPGSCEAGVYELLGSRWTRFTGSHPGLWVGAL